MGRLVSWLKNHYPALVIAGAVFFSVTFASQCSFLYRWNSWNDVHCYYTVAMMMRNGSVLYRDICEHKGPYFYFLHYAASGMTPGSFLGMYFVELIYGWVFAYASYKTLKLFIQSAMRCTIGTTAILVAFYIPISFFHGDSVEEMMTPLYALSLYWLLKMVKTGNEMRWYELGLSGLFCGLAMLSKFNLMSFYLGFGIAAFVLFCMKHRAKQGFLAALYFLLGFVLSTIPALIYLGLTQSFGDFFDIYVYRNLFNYSTAAPLEPQERLKMMGLVVVTRYAFGYTYYLLIIPAIIYAIITKKYQNLPLLVSLFLPYAILNLVLIIGGVSYMYYGQPNAAFAFLGIVMIDRLLQRSPKAVAFTKKHNKKIVPLSFAVLALLSFFGTPNMPQMFVKEEDIPQYQMKAIIEKEENPTLLNYGTLDAGLYGLCNILPTTKYFMGNNAHFEDLKEEQDRIVNEGLVTFVYARADHIPEKIDVHYELVYQAPDIDFFSVRTHHLYRHK